MRLPDSRRRGLLAGTAALVAGVLGGVLAAPRGAWARAGGPDWLAAARGADGAHVLVGLDGAAREVFRLPLPGRGHAAARHPARPEAVAFARRPGTFALVIDCALGRETCRLEAPAGRHFYGHGAFSADGGLLITTENAFESGEGRLGIWDAGAGYARLGEIASGGIGPHEVVLMPDGAHLAVANGGIRTHPDSGREKLNLAEMDPSVCLVALATGRVVATHRPPPDLRMNSVRHLAVAADGTLAAAMQWEGVAGAAPPLLALIRPGGGMVLLRAPAHVQRRSGDYGGSAAFSGDGRKVAVTAPRGNMMLVFDVAGGGFAGRLAEADICGVAPAPGGFLCTTGTGAVLAVDGGARAERLGAWPLAFDNHVVPV